MKQFKRLFLMLLLIAGLGSLLMFGVVYSQNPSNVLAPDSDGYEDTARAFLQTGRFDVSLDNPGVPQMRRTPGYPLFLAGFFALFGESHIPVVLMQIGLWVGTLALTYALASRFWNPRTAFLAALMLALDIPSLVSPQKILTDTLFTFTLILAILVGTSALSSASPDRVRLSGHVVLLALATLIRPVTYYAIVLILVIALFRQLRSQGRRCSSLGLTLGAVLLPWLLLIGGWQARNYVRTGSPEFSGVIGENLFFYRGARILAERDGMTYKEALYFLGHNRYAEVHPETQTWSIARLEAQWKREGLGLISRHPWLFLKSLLRGSVKMMAMPGEDHLLAHLGEYHETSGPVGDWFRLAPGAYGRKWILHKPGHFLLFLAAALYLLLLYTGAAVSVWQILRAPRDPQWHQHLLIWAMFVYLLLVSISAGPEAYSRFRIPLMPLWSLYAGKGISLLLDWSKRMRHHLCS